MTRLTGVDAVLLDAGGVLIDLDYAYLQRLIAPCREVEIAALQRGEALARRDVDRLIRHGHGDDRWREYFRLILNKVGVGATDHDEIIDALWQAHRRVGLWTVAVDGSPAAVAGLRAVGFRLGVVSNAEGQVERDLENAGYADAFETVVDSEVVGVAKPDPGIFAIALERMSLRPDRTLFVGDVPSVDVNGARAAGIRPVLLDRFDLYEESDAPRIRTLAELVPLIELQNSEA